MRTGSTLCVGMYISVIVIYDHVVYVYKFARKTSDRYTMLACAAIHGAALVYTCGTLAVLDIVFLAEAEECSPLVFTSERTNFAIIPFTLILRKASIIIIEIHRMSTRI